MCVCVCVCVCKKSAHKAVNHLQCHAGEDREVRALVMGINVAAVPHVRYSHIIRIMVTNGLVNSGRYVTRSTQNC